MLLGAAAAGRAASRAARVKRRCAENGFYIVMFPFLGYKIQVIKSGGCPPQLGWCYTNGAIIAVWYAVFCVFSKF